MKYLIYFNKKKKLSLYLILFFTLLLSIILIKLNSNISKNQSRNPDNINYSQKSFKSKDGDADYSFSKKQSEIKFANSDTNIIKATDTKGKIWFYESGNLYHDINVTNNDEKGEQFGVFAHIANFNVNFILFNNSNEIFLGTDNGLETIDNTNKTFTNVAFPNQNVYKYFFDTSGRLFLFISNQKLLYQHSYNSIYSTYYSSSNDYTKYTEIKSLTDINIKIISQNYLTKQYWIITNSNVIYYSKKNEIFNFIKINDWLDKDIRYFLIDKNSKDTFFVVYDEGKTSLYKNEWGATSIQSVGNFSSSDLPHKYLIKTLVINNLLFLLVSDNIDTSTISTNKLYYFNLSSDSSKITEYKPSPKSFAVDGIENIFITKDSQLLLFLHNKSAGYNEYIEQISVDSSSKINEFFSHHVIITLTDGLLFTCIGVSQDYANNYYIFTNYGLFEMLSTTVIITSYIQAVVNEKNTFNSKFGENWIVAKNIFLFSLPSDSKEKVYVNGKLETPENNDFKIVPHFKNNINKYTIDIKTDDVDQPLFIFTIIFYKILMNSTDLDMFTSPSSNKKVKSLYYGADYFCNYYAFLGGDSSAEINVYENSLYAEYLFSDYTIQYRKLQYDGASKLLIENDSIAWQNYVPNLILDETNTTSYYEIKISNIFGTNSALVVIQLGGESLMLSQKPVGPSPFHQKSNFNKVFITVIIALLALFMIVIILLIVF